MNTIALAGIAPVGPGGLAFVALLPSKQSIIRNKLPKGPTGLLGRSPPGLRRSLVYLY